MNGATTIALTIRGERVELQATTIANTRVWKIKHHTIPKSGLDSVYEAIGKDRVTGPSGTPRGNSGATITLPDSTSTSSGYDKYQCTLTAPAPSLSRLRPLAPGSSCGLCRTGPVAARSR